MPATHSQIRDHISHAGAERIHYRDSHRYIQACEAPLMECARCRRELAGLLAERLGFDVRQALDLQVDLEDLPDATAAEIEGAEDVRRLTVLACFLHQPDFSGYQRGTTIDQLIVADAFAATPGSAEAPLRATPQAPGEGLRRFFFWRQRMKQQVPQSTAAKVAR